MAKDTESSLPSADRVHPSFFSVSLNESVSPYGLHMSMLGTIPKTSKARIERILSALQTHLYLMQTQYLERNRHFVESIRVNETKTNKEARILNEYDHIKDLEGSLRRHIGEQSPYPEKEGLFWPLFLLVHRFEGAFDESLGALSISERASISHALLSSLHLPSSEWSRKIHDLAYSMISTPTTLDGFLARFRAHRLEQMIFEKNPMQDIRIFYLYQIAASHLFQGVPVMRWPMPDAGQDLYTQHIEEAISNVMHSFQGCLSTEGLLNTLMCYLLGPVALSCGIFLNQEGYFKVERGISLETLEAFHFLLSSLLGLEYKALLDLSSDASSDASSVSGSLLCFHMSVDDKRINIAGLDLDFIRSQLGNTLASNRYLAPEKETPEADGRIFFPEHTAPAPWENTLNEKPEGSSFTWSELWTLQGSKLAIEQIDHLDDKSILLPTIVRGRATKTLKAFQEKGWVSWGQLLRALLGTDEGTEETRLSHLLSSRTSADFIQAVCEVAFKEEDGFSKLVGVLSLPVRKDGLTHFNKVIATHNPYSFRALVRSFITQGMSGMEALKDCLLSPARMIGESHFSQLLSSVFAPNFLGVLSEELSDQVQKDENLSQVDVVSWWNVLFCSLKGVGEDSHLHTVILNRDVETFHVIVGLFSRQGEEGLDVLTRLLFSRYREEDISHMICILQSSLSEFVSIVCEAFLGVKGGWRLLETLLEHMLIPGRWPIRDVAISKVILNAMFRNIEVIRMLRPSTREKLFFIPSRVGRGDLLVEALSQEDMSGKGPVFSLFDLEGDQDIIPSIALAFYPYLYPYQWRTYLNQLANTIGSKKNAYLKALQEALYKQVSSSGIELMESSFDAVNPSFLSHEQGQPQFSIEQGSDAGSAQYAIEKICSMLSEIKDEHIEQNQKGVEALLQIPEARREPIQKVAITFYQRVVELKDSFERHIGEESFYLHRQVLREHLNILISCLQKEPQTVPDDVLSVLKKELLLHSRQDTESFHKEVMYLIYVLNPLPKTLKDLIEATKSRKEAVLRGDLTAYGETVVRVSQTLMFPVLGMRPERGAIALLPGESSPSMLPEKVMSTCYQTGNTWLSPYDSLKSLLHYIKEVVARACGVVLDARWGIDSEYPPSAKALERLNQFFSELLFLEKKAMASCDDKESQIGSLQCFQMKFKAGSSPVVTGLCVTVLSGLLKNQLKTEGYWVSKPGKDASKCLVHKHAFWHPDTFKTLSKGEQADVMDAMTPDAPGGMKSLQILDHMLPDNFSGVSEERDEGFPFAWAEHIVLRDNVDFFHHLEGIEHKDSFIRTMIRGCCLKSLFYFEARGWLNPDAVRHALLEETPAGDSSQRIADVFVNTLTTSRLIGQCSPLLDIFSQRDSVMLSVIFRVLLSLGEQGLRLIEKMFQRRESEFYKPYLSQVCVERHKAHLIRPVCEELLRVEGGAEALSNMLNFSEKGEFSAIKIVIFENNKSAFQTIVHGFLKKGAEGLKALQELLLSSETSGETITHLSYILVSAKELFFVLSQELLHVKGGADALSNMLCAIQKNRGNTHFQEVIVLEDRTPILSEIMHCFLTGGAAGLQALQRLFNARAGKGGNILPHFMQLLVGSTPVAMIEIVSHAFLKRGLGKEWVSTLCARMDVDGDQKTHFQCALDASLTSIGPIVKVAEVFVEYGDTGLEHLKKLFSLAAKTGRRSYFAQIFSERLFVFEHLCDVLKSKEGGLQVLVELLVDSRIETDGRIYNGMSWLLKHHKARAQAFLQMIQEIPTAGVRNPLKENLKKPLEKKEKKDFDEAWRRAKNPKKTVAPQTLFGGGANKATGNQTPAPGGSGDVAKKKRGRR